MEKLTNTDFYLQVSKSETIVEEDGLIFHFNGYHTVNVYLPVTGKNVYCFTVGDFVDNSASIYQFRKGVAEYLNDR